MIEIGIVFFCIIGYILFITPIAILLVAAAIDYVNDEGYLLTDKIKETIGRILLSVLGEIARDIGEEHVGFCIGALVILFLVSQLLAIFWIIVTPILLIIFALRGMRFINRMKKSLKKQETRVDKLLNDNHD